MGDIVMDAAYIQRHHIIDRYVQGKLDDAERDAFEIFMLEHPALADDVELARGYLKAIDAQDGDLQAERNMSGDSTRVHKLWRPLAVAASILLAVSLGFLGIGSADVDQSAGPVAGVPEQVIRLELLRSDTIPRYVIGNMVKLEIEVDDSEQGPFSILIRQDGGDLEQRREQLYADDGFVVAHIVHPPAGRYSVSVERSGGSASRREFRFELYSNP